MVTYPCLKAKIKTLQARCLLQNGLVDEALRHLEDAVSSMGYNFPKNRTIIKFKSWLLLQEQKFMLTFLRDRTVGIADGDAADYNDQLSKCLSQMFTIFKVNYLLNINKHLKIKLNEIFC